MPMNKTEYPAERLVLDFRVTIRKERHMSDGHYGPTGMGDHLEFSQQLTLPVRDFLEMAQILGRFHELAERIRKGEQ